MKTQKEKYTDDPEYQMELMAAKIQGCVNFLMGLAIDPAIPSHARTAIREKARELDEFLIPLEK